MTYIFWLWLSSPLIVVIGFLLYQKPEPEPLPRYLCPLCLQFIPDGGVNCEACEYAYDPCGVDQWQIAEQIDSIQYRTTRGDQ
jgi:hypothetical protein